MMDIYAIPRIWAKLTAHDLQLLYRDLQENGRVQPTKKGGSGLSSTTARSLHLMLHCAFERAVKERLIRRNPNGECVLSRLHTRHQASPGRRVAIIAYAGK